MTKNFSAKKISEEGIICIHPFALMYFSPNGNVSTCTCPDHPKYHLGNIKQNSIAELWNNDTVRWIRSKMHEGEWQDICNPNCPVIIDYLRANKFIKYKELEKIDFLSPGLIKEVKAGKDCLQSPPVYFQPDISISVSTVCNLHCIMCEERHIKSDPVAGKKLWADLKQYLPTAKCIELTGWGDPFVRPETKDLLIHYRGPAKFRIITNGLLLPKYWERIKHQKFLWLKISIDAATKETYEKIRIGGRWEDLIEALNLVKQNGNKFKIVALSMTVMRSNYREIPQFIDLAESYGFGCLFHRIHGKRGSENEDIFKLNDIKALTELKDIIINENAKKRNIYISWLDLPYYLNF